MTDEPITKEGVEFAAAAAREADVRANFDATYWNFWLVVAWIFYRTTEQLGEFISFPRRARWYSCGADAVLRRAIERGEVTGFDENGCKIEPAAVLGRDPNIRFDSRVIKTYWTTTCSPLVDKASTSPGISGRWKVKPGATLTLTETAICDALNALWPVGNPDHKARGRDNDICTWLRKQNHSSVSPRTIQRALKKIHFA